jgi:hypothetical protein
MAATITCSFITPKGIQALGGPLGMANVRTREDLAPANGTTTNTAQPGEVAYVGNGFTSAVAVASGSVPDAATTTASAASSAGFCLGVGQSVMISVQPGDKVNVKTIA